MGHRLGGKAASGRDEHGRILEHGLHILFGFYENFFRLVRQAYAEVDRPAEHPMATWRHAFHPAGPGVLCDGDVPVVFQYPSNSSTPGDGTRSEPHELAQAALLAALEVAGGWDRLHDAVAPQDAESWLARPSEAPAAFEPARRGLMRAAMALGRGLRLESPLRALRESTSLRRRLLDGVAGLPPAWRAPAQLMDLWATLALGLLADDIRDLSDLARLDAEDWDAWLDRHGAHPSARRGPWARSVYDAAFSFGDGDPERPSVGAGSAILGQLLGSFTYKGSCFYKMQTGMVDAVFGPLYLALQDRGGRVHFFHRVRSLHVDGDRIGAVSLERQVDFPDYQPLIDVEGLECWPEGPAAARGPRPMARELVGRGRDAAAPGGRAGLRPPRLRHAGGHRRGALRGAHRRLAAMGADASRGALHHDHRGPAVVRVDPRRAGLDPGRAAPVLLPAAAADLGGHEPGARERDVEAAQPRVLLLRHAGRPDACAPSGGRSRLPRSRECPFPGPGALGAARRLGRERDSPSWARSDTADGAPGMVHHWGTMDSSSVMLLVLRDGQPVKAVAVGERGVHIGRGRDADLSLVDEHVSFDHARVWLERGEVLVRDLGSRNGTFVNDTRISEPTALTDDDLLKLGPDTELRLRILGGVQAPSTLVLVDLDAGVRTPLHRGDNEVGDLLIRVDDQGAIFLMGVPTRELTLGEEFDVAGHGWLIRTAEDRGGPTTEVEGAVPTVRLEVRLDGPTGPEARFLDLRQPGRELRISAATQAEVLFVLAKQLEDDRAKGDAEPGWLSNTELRQAVWGRQADRLHRSRLPVVLHRIRKALEGEGFPDDCIGRRRGGSRLFVAEVALG
ncbi:MAG: FHA domain-containing protein [Proteobacteria bacterium]|nr:FHA domain-containing protein [Pseudomonadota bacterium]